MPTSSMYPIAQTTTSPSMHFSFMPSRIQSSTPTRTLSPSTHPSEIPVPIISTAAPSTVVPTKISQSKSPSISPIKPTPFPSVRPTESTQPRSPTISPIIPRAFPSTIPTKTIQSKSPTASPSVAVTTPPAKGAEFHSNLTINNAFVASQVYLIYSHFFVLCTQCLNFDNLESGRYYTRVFQSTVRSGYVHLNSSSDSQRFIY